MIRERTASPASLVDRLPQQVASLRTGTWQVGVGDTPRGKALGILGFGTLGRVVAG